MTIVPEPGAVPLQMLKAVNRGGVPMTPSAGARQAVCRAAKAARAIAAADEVANGINIGFGTLPSIRIPAGGLTSGHTCDLPIATAGVDVASATPGCSAVLNGRFRRDWTTRPFVRPETGVHAMQMDRSSDPSRD